MKELAFWLRRVRFWLREMGAFLVTLLCVLLVLSAAFYPWPTEDSLRVGGWFLQMFGVGTVAWGINQTRTHFGLPGLLTSAKLWLSRFPPFRPTPIYGRAEGIVGTFGTGRARLRVGVPPGASLEQRIEALEKNLQLTQDESDKDRTTIESTLGDHAKKIAQEQSAREMADRRLSDKLTMAHTGGLDVSFAGVIYFSLGITLSTIPKEIIYFMDLVARS